MASLLALSASQTSLQIFEGNKGDSMHQWQCASLARWQAKPCPPNPRCPHLPPLPGAPSAPHMTKDGAKARPLGPAKPAAASAATTASPADAWSIPAVLPCASDCGHTASQQDGVEAGCTASESTPEVCTAIAASAAPCLSLDLELSPDEVSVGPGCCMGVLVLPRMTY